MSCPHQNFSASVDVGRVVDESGTLLGRYTVEVRAQCSACGKHLEFQGLPVGVDTHGPTRSVDGLEARLVAEVVDEPAIVSDRIAAIFNLPEGRS